MSKRGKLLNAALQDLAPLRPSKHEQWIPSELRILEAHYKSLLAKEICEKYLPYRSLNAIHMMAVKIGAGKFVSEEWTEDEQGRLKELYPQNGLDCAQFFPNRAVAAVQNKASKLGLSTYWTDDEILLLRAKYPTIGTGCESLLPRHDRRSVKIRLGDLRLSA